MRYPHEDLEQSSFGFQYLSPPSISLQLMSIGWETVRSSSYRWEGVGRGGGIDAIFQFTLSGNGAIRYGDTTYEVDKHKGFLCTFPSDHVYYFPEHAEHWEFIYIVVRGLDAITHWTDLIEQLGPVVSFHDHTKPPWIISQLYSEIYRNPQMDKYRISAKLYEYVVEMHRIAEGKDVTSLQDIPLPIRKAMEWMQGHYAADLSLDDLATHAGLSKYYFCRLFQKKTGLQPIQYLRKIRIERASWLLRHTTKTIEKISAETGFDNSNYFIKVFKSFVGTTPNEYRLGKTIQPVHFLRIEK